jgi:NADPH:quinone reductase-like Zn-dependent oxidoreductase
MKTVRFHEHGGRDVLQLETVPAPTPAPGEVLVRVRACGVNHLDADIREGVSRFQVELPHQLGIEFAGDVVAVGHEAGAFREGERVWALQEIPCFACDFCRAGLDNICRHPRMHGVQRPGGYAENVAVPVDAVFPLADAISYEVAGAGQTGFRTAWHMLHTRAHVREGDTVLVNGAAGSVGHAAVQIATLAGAIVIASAGNPVKLEHARRDGAVHTIDYSCERITERVMELTSGDGVDIVVEHVGGDCFTQSLECLKRRGRLITCGAHAGEVVDLDIVRLFRMEWEIYGARTATVAETKHVFELFEDRTLEPRIHCVLPLEEAAEAQRIVEEREQSGKVLLAP